jgi:hypothetical protein
LGKNGYDLEKDMKIRVNPAPPDDIYKCDGDGADDFFDSFAAPKQHHMSKNARKKNFNKKPKANSSMAQNSSNWQLVRVSSSLICLAIPARRLSVYVP